MTCKHRPVVRASRLGLAVLGATALTLTAGPAVAAPAPAPVAVSAAPVEAAATTQAVERATGLLRKAEARARAPRVAPEPAKAVVGTSLPRGAALAAGDSIASPSGQYSLVVDPDGAVLWQKAPNRLNPQPYALPLLFGEPGSRLVFQDDGNVVLYGPDGQVHGELETAGSDAQSLVVQDDGNIVLYGPGGAVVVDFETAESPELIPGATLLPGERARSRGGAGDTFLIMQPDGNLVLYTGSTPRFATGTSVPGSAAVLQSDGNFVVYSPTNAPLFNSGTGGGDLSLLVVEDREFRVLAVSLEDEGVSVYSGFGSAWGSSVVEPGQVLLPGDRRTAPGGVLLVLQTDGNLVQYVNGRARFTARTRGDLALMQPDGNFVVYAFDLDSDDVRPVFNTRTQGNPGSRLVVQSDGNVVVYSPTNRALYATRR